MSKLLITITAQDRDAMLDLLSKYRVEIIRQTVQMLGEGQGFTVDAIAETEQFEKLRDLGYQVEIKEDLEQVGKARQALVGKGDRFRG